MKNKCGTKEIIATIWVVLALGSLIPTTMLLQASFPIFTAIWLVVPLVVLIFTRDAHRIGFRRVPWSKFLITVAINLGLLLLISLIVEPWTHTYQALVRNAITGTPPDTTFAWLVRFKGAIAWSCLLLYSGLVTIFGEELFFRGWVLQALQVRMNRVWAMLLQAILFTLPQILAAWLLPPTQGVVYAVVYSLLGVGIVGGWAAARTQSIWPSLAAATLWNLIMVAIVL